MGWREGGERAREGKSSSSYVNLCSLLLYLPKKSYIHIIFPLSPFPRSLWLYEVRGLDFTLAAGTPAVFFSRACLFAFFEGRGGGGMA